MYSLFLKLRDLAETSPAKHDQIVFFSLVISLLLNIILWLVVLIVFWNSKEYIILQYNMYFGISSFGSWYRLLSLPFLGLVAIAINSYLSFKFYLEYRVLSRILPVTAVLINLIFLVVVSLLIYMNI